MSVRNMTAQSVLRDIAARDQRGESIDPEHALILFWQAFCERWDIEKMSADEIPFDAPLTDHQKEAVRAFSTLWSENQHCDIEDIPNARG